MRGLKLSVALVFMALLVVGCGNAMDNLDRNDEYKKALPHNKPLVLPADISDKAIDNHYPVPKARSSNAGSASTIPPGCKLSKK